MSEPTFSQATKKDDLNIIADKMDIVIDITAAEVIKMLNKSDEVRMAVLSGIKVSPADFLINPWDMQTQDERHVTFIKNDAKLKGRSGVMKVEFVFNDFNAEEI